jgi:hypothetical protein
MSDLPPISDAPIFKTMVSYGSSVLLADTIEYEGKLWLVLKWLFPLSKEWREPERLICISNLKFQDLRGSPNRLFDFCLSAPLPMVLFESIPKLPVEQYIVIEHPHIRFRMPSIH